MYRDLGLMVTSYQIPDTGIFYNVTRQQAAPVESTHTGPQSLSLSPYTPPPQQLQTGVSYFSKCVLSSSGPGPRSISNL